MEKKFLDKKGLAEFCKSFKDKFVSKSDLKQVSDFMSKMSFEEQKQYWIKQIEDNEMVDIFDYMLLRGKYCPRISFNLDSNLQFDSNGFTKEQQATMGAYMTNTFHQMTVETSYYKNRNIEQLAYNSSRSIIAFRGGRFVGSYSSAPSDEDLIDILNQSRSFLSLHDHFKIEWGKWTVRFQLEACDLPFTPDINKPYGLLSREDKQKLIEMPKLVFLEKEQYVNFSEKEKMDNTKLYYIYAERPQ